jgi:ubiquinone biosynthesis monooxygenase Coq7
MTGTDEKPIKRQMPLPGARSEDTRRKAMVRVDHAGEFGAVRIYEGQLAVLRGRPGMDKTVAEIEEMASQEDHHLQTFDRLVNERRVRPTALAPVWHAAGFALGAATALMGPKAAMACTAAVETEIDNHYAAQLAELEGKDPELETHVEIFREEEIEHRDKAIAHGAEEATAYPLLSRAIRLGCRAAIRLSEKI